MHLSQRRIQEELRMIERQLPLYQQKINELEKRKMDLHSHLDRQSTSTNINNQSNDEDHSKTFAKEDSPHLPLPPANKSTTYTNNDLNISSHKMDTKTNAQIKYLGAKIIPKLNKVLYEAREKFNILGESMSQTASYIDTISLILKLMEQSRGDIHQNLLKIANALQQDEEKVNNITDKGKSSFKENDSIPVEALVEVLKSPFFQQLVSQIKSTE